MALFESTQRSVDKMESKVGNAHSVWLLMGRDYRISRSIRVQWFFQHMNTVVIPKTNDEEIVNSSEELEVISVLANESDIQMKSKKLQVVPTTRLSFVGRQYRFVFCLDMTPSLARVDNESGNVLFDEMFDNIKNCLMGLIQPFIIPGSTFDLSPLIHVTILAHTCLDVKECKVLVQGFCINEVNIAEFLNELKKQFVELETIITNDLKKKGRESGETMHHQEKRKETMLFYIIRDGLFALQLLPENASAALIVVTDGVFILENAIVADALLAQVRHSTCICSFLQVGSRYRRPSIDFGFVPQCELMQFIAAATSGAYFATSPKVQHNNGCMGPNIYHKALFCWNFQKSINCDKIDILSDLRSLIMVPQLSSDNLTLLNTSQETPTHLPPQPQQTMTYMQFELHTKLTNVLTVRSREGYITDAIRITKNNKNESHIEFKLIWPWKEDVNIEYVAKTRWGLKSEVPKTYVLVKVSGPYEFLVDIASSKPKNYKGLRKIALQQFDYTMKSLEFSDQLLVHLQLFSSHPYASKIPDIILKGSALFIMPSSGNAPVPILPAGGKKMPMSPEAQFIAYWKPVVNMDTKSWTKWFHCHRISFLLQHDRPVSKDFFVPTSNGNYPQVSCRSSYIALNQLIKRWCTFTLLEYHSYIKFIPGPEEPTSFCLLRLTFKGLCVVIRVAFLGGTPGKQRSQEVEELRESLRYLKAPIDKTATKGNYSRDATNSSVVEIPCIIFLNKQFERIFVKYDSIPDDIYEESHSVPFDKAVGYDSVSMLQKYSNGDQTRIPKSVLSQYLLNQRWIWNVRVNDNLILSPNDVSQILTAVVRRRLYEGFNYCSSNTQGIVTLVKEVPTFVDEINISSCIVQYVIFPPHHKVVTKSSLVEESGEGETAVETEGDLQMVMELWIEPQRGEMESLNTPLSYLKQKKYFEIAQELFEVDSRIVCEISSYIATHSTSINKDLTSRCLSIPHQDINGIISANDFESTCNVMVPFLFDLTALLKKSKLVLGIYPLLKVPETNSTTETESPNDILFTYLEKTLHNMNDQMFHLDVEQKREVCFYIKQHCNENLTNVWKSEMCVPMFNEEIDGIDIKCCVKTFGSTIIITIYPATLNDLNKWVKDPTNIIGRQSIPFFVFECDYHVIQSVNPLVLDQDFLQNYVYALNESALTPRHMNQKLPEGRSREIALFCQALYDRYFWALVSTIYKCLQKNFLLDTDDVELAIELVCEESIKEIDLTSFVQTLCAHYRNNALPSAGVSFEDIFSNENIAPVNKNLLRVQGRNSSSSSVVSSKASTKRKNKNLKIQEEIQEQFLKILKKSFVPVPNNPFILFYKDSEETDDNDGNVDQQDSNTDHDAISLRSSFSNTTDTSFDDTYSLSGPDENNAMILNDNIVDANHETIISNFINERPMFLHLTCTCHYKGPCGNTIRPISVTTLPTCIMDILSEIGNFGSEIDPYSPYLSITLDLICLTQPPEPDEGDEWKVEKDIKIMRQDSAESFYSSQEGGDRDTRKCLITQDSHDPSLNHELSDAIKMLPSKQRKSLESIEKEIKWLLEDEIASAFRMHGPILEENLEIVAQHVQQSKTFKKNCIFEKRYFMFVSGQNPDVLSLPMFMCELESVTLGKYKLKRVGKYYCVVLNPDFDVESDTETTLNMKDVKEEAKVFRKGLGHRRSQSDFTNSHNLFIEDVSFQGEGASRSLPDISASADEYVMMNPSQVSDLWQNVATSSRLERFSYSTTTSSKGDSTPYLDPNSERDYLQRSLSYTEQDRNIYEHHKRRRFSCPNLTKFHSGVIGRPNQQIPNIEATDETVPSSVNAGGETYDNEAPYLSEDDDYFQPHPDFWLFMYISGQSVDVYLHRRRSDLTNNFEHHQSVYNRLLESMDQICKVVNQRILLENLYTTNQCHTLLIAEDEEEIWRKTSKNESHANSPILKGESATAPLETYMLIFQPGYFECEMVWKKNIPIHARLCSSNTTGGPSKGLLAAQSEFTKKFRVDNRQNIYVYRETESQNVFYFRIHENDNNLSIDPAPDSETLFTPVQEDFLLQSSFRKNDKFDVERQDSYPTTQTSQKSGEDKLSIKDGSTHLSNYVQQYIQFCVYGIREPGNEVKVELVKLITRKLDSATLDTINLSLERNPKCKLTPQDVEFIQPPGTLPARKLSYCVTTAASQYMNAVIYYLHQHMLKRFTTPRFQENRAENFFRNYTLQKPTWLSADAIYPNNVYLYNREGATSKKGTGIGIVYITLVDQDGINIVSTPCYPTQIYDESALEQQQKLYENMTRIQKFEDVNIEDSTMNHHTILEFSIWERGDIDLNSFEKVLKNCLLHALIDVFLEFQLFATPLCFVPKHLQGSAHTSRRESFAYRSYTFSRHDTRSSSSSSITTPKSIKMIPGNKNIFSEPTTPSDLKNVSLNSDSTSQGKPNNISVEKRSLVDRNKGNRTPDEVEKKRKDSKRESPFLPLKKSSREHSPLVTKRSFGSRTSSVHSESDFNVPLPHTQQPNDDLETTPKSITMSELNQIPVQSNYVMLTDAEVHESFRAVIENDQKNNASTTWQEIEISRRLELDKRKERRKLEHGCDGNLHMHYHENAQELLEKVLEQGNESVYKHKGLLNYTYSMEMIVKEFCKELHEASPDMFPKIYKCKKSFVDGEVTISFPRLKDRSAVMTDESEETSMDFREVNSSVIPGHHEKYIVACHNAHKWLMSIGTDEAELSDNEEGKSSLEEHCKQNFKPMNVWNFKNDTQSSNDRRFYDNEPPSCMTSIFIPRQKLFLAIFDQGKVTMYAYNFITEVSKSLDKQLMRMYAWNNVRSHMNLCLYTQKLGLFHHIHLVRDCPDKDGDHVVASILGNGSRPNYLPLMKSITPKVKERSKPEQERIHPGVKPPDFDAMFRDTAPSKCLHKAPYFNERDLVKRQAVQFEDVRRTKLILLVQNRRLREIYDAWKQEGAHIPISEERLQLLKKQSRFQHYCDAPLLFNLPNLHPHDSLPNKNDERENKDDIVKSSDSDESEAKEKWYDELRWTMVDRYNQYLQTLGLCLVQISNSKSALRKEQSNLRSTSNRSARNSNKSSDGYKETTLSEERPSCYHLQKTTAGGILLMRVYFRGDYLCYNMFSLESVSLPGVSRYVSAKDQRNFYEDCNWFKDLTHLRSFVYDFHIRQIQMHLSSRHSVFQKTYPIHKIMEMILKEFPKAPRFSRCILADGICSLPCTPGLTPEVVYEYFVNHSAKYDMTKIRIGSSSKPARSADYALTYSYSTGKDPIEFKEKWRTKRDVTEYDGNIAVYFQPTYTQDVFTVPFFVVLGNKKEWYPRRHLLSSVSSLRRRHRTTSGMDGNNSDTGRTKGPVRFSVAAESLTEEPIPQVQSSGGLKRSPSWNQALSSTESIHRTSISSIRTSGSDSTITYLSRTSVSPRVSPGKSLTQEISGSPESESIKIEPSSRSTSLTQEAFLQSELKFLSAEVLKTREKLNEKIGACLSHCWRDTIWLELLSGVCCSEDDVVLRESQKKTRKRGGFDMSSSVLLVDLIRNWREENRVVDICGTPSCSLHYEAFRRLIRLISQYKIKDIDSRVSQSFEYTLPALQHIILKNLTSKYGPYCRRFISDDGRTTCLCILNPGNLDMFFLCEANETENKMEFSVVYRQKPSVEPIQCREDEELRPVERASRSHIENVITCLCFNLWAQLLP